MKINRITIAGLGLIGGSLAKAFRRTNPDFFIAAVDTNKDDLDAAVAEGIIDHSSTAFDHVTVKSQVVFLCTPLKTLPALLESLAGLVAEGTIITDTASVKAPIMRAAKDLLPEGVHFIGGHPMSGTEQSGYAASISHLFENAYYIMTPQDNVSTDELDTLSQLLASTGALPLVISPEEHDEKVGAVSHLPHVAAAALVNTIYGLDDPNSLTSRLAAGGFKDITRIASSNPKMWAHISQINKDHLLPLVNKLIGELSSFKDRLKQDKPLALEDFFHRAKLSRDHIPTRENLYLLPFHELYVDVEDRPGMISLVTTILGDNQVNIKNIRIINSREDQPGCLLLSLNDAQSLKKAKNLLTEIGLKAYIR